MTPEMALRLGRAFILFLAERGVPRPRIVLGRDTRLLLLDPARRASYCSGKRDDLL